MPLKYKKRLPEGPFYRDLGHNIRLARSAAGKSQMDTAENIDVTFQQLQKYETGTNRIPIDRLIGLADYLDVPLSQFVGETGTGANSALQSLIEHFNSKEFQTLLKSWAAIEDPRLRSAVVNFVKSLAALRD